MSDRFDLEQGILNTGTLTDMLTAALEQYAEDKNADKLAKDVAAIKTVLDIQYEKVWRIFEDCIRNRDV